jgi:predicted enzyme related to lactoylglutathione lyase
MKLDAVLLYVRDFDRALAFYRDVLELAVSEMESGTGYARLKDWVMLETGGAAVELFDEAVHAPPSRPPQERENAAILAFRVADLPATVQTLKLRGAAVDEHEILVEEWGRAAFLRDPEGNSIQLFEY